MNAKQAAKFLEVSVRQVYDLAAPQGPIPCTRIGARVVFDQDDVEGFKAACRYTKTKSAVVSSLNSAVTSAANESALESYCRRNGLKLRLTSGTAKKPRDSTQSQPA